MIYLILAIISSALVSFAMRLSEGYRKNHITMLAINYISCLILGAIYTGWNNIFVSDVVLSSGYITSLLFGILQGILYLVSFLLLQLNITKNGVVLSATFMKLGVLVPTLCAMLLFNEIPTISQLIGVFIAISGILMINLEKEKTQANYKMALVILLIVGGSTDVIAKFYDEIGNVAFKNQFLFYTFLVACILCTCIALVKKQRFCIWDVIFGIFIGIPNYYSARFLLNALLDIPAIVAYPTYSIATIILVTLSGILFFHEKLSKRQLFSIGIILLSLLLLNL